MGITKDMIKVRMRLFICIKELWLLSNRNLEELEELEGFEGCEEFKKIAKNSKYQKIWEFPDVL